MKDKKKIEILLNVIERVYSQNPGMQTLIDICKEEDVSPEQVFFLLFFAVGFIVVGYLNINFLYAKDSLFLVVIKKKNFLTLKF